MDAPSWWLDEGRRGRVARLGGLVLVAGVLAAGGAREAVRMREAILRAAAAGEALIARGVRGAALPGADRPRAVGVPLVPARGADSSAADAVRLSVQVPGAPAGYVLTRTRDGCWRLPASGHCWRARSSGSP